MTEQQYPEPTVGLVIFNPENKILMVKSHKWHNKYIMPGGHIEVGESFEQAAKREIKEETGLDIHDIKFLCLHEHIFGKEFHKKKHFVFLDFTAKTDSSKVVLNDEAQEYKWVTIQEALDMDLEHYTRKTIEKLK